MCKKSSGNILPGCGLFHCRRKCSHRTVIGVHNSTVFCHILFHILTQHRDFGKLLFIVQILILSHSSGLSSFTAYDQVLNYHIREAKSNGIKVAKFCPCCLLHSLSPPLHGFKGCILMKCFHVDFSTLFCRIQTGRPTHQADNQHYRLQKLFRRLKGHGKPVKLLIHCQISIHTGCQLNIRSSNINSEKHLILCHLWQRCEDRFPMNFLVLLPNRHLFCYISLLKSKLIFSFQKNCQHPFIYIQALSISKTFGFQKPRLEHVIKTSSQLCCFLIF